MGFVAAAVHDAPQGLVVGSNLEDALPEWFDEGDHVLGELFFQVAVANLAAVVEVVEVLDGVGRGDGAEEAEEVLDFFGFLLVHLGGAAVALGFHNLLADDGGFVGEEDGAGFAFALAHLAAAVESGDLHEAGLGAYGLGEREDVGAVHGVEALCEGARHFEVLLLVFADGDACGLVDEDVGGHEGGVSEQAGVDVVGVLAHFVLEGGDALELAEVGVHVQEEVELDGLREVALEVDGGLLGVEACGEVLDEDGASVLVDAAGSGVSGQGVVVGHEEVAVVDVLHGDEVAQGAEIIAEVQVAGGAYTATYYIFSHRCVVLCMGAKIHIFHE